MAAVKIGPHTLSRGQIVPFRHSSKSAQQVQEAEDASVTVVGGGPARRFFSFKVKLPRAEALRLKDYVENSLRFRAETCQVTDGYGVTRTMRYWDDDVIVDLAAGDQASIDWLFREEVYA